MKNYPVDLNTLTSFSQSLPYTEFSPELTELLAQLNQLAKDLNFPAITADIGSFIAFMLPFWKPKTIFEMGSGYGHSAFWYFTTKHLPENVVLTEKRGDLLKHFNELTWPSEWRSRMDYYQGDAFEKLSETNNIDFVLIDGVKADYLRFLNEVYPRLSDDGIVLIDNSYWRGSFLDEEILKTKQSAQNIKELHDHIKVSKNWSAIFVPYIDGLTILQKTTF